MTTFSVRSEGEYITVDAHSWLVGDNDVLVFVDDAGQELAAFRYWDYVKEK